MSATAGYQAALFITSSAGTAMAAEPMEQLSGNVYIISDADKTFLDPRATVTVTDNVGVVDPDDYVIDYLLGQVIFDAPPTEPVTIGASYLTLYPLPACKSFSINIARTLLDTTVQGDEAVDRSAGLLDVTGTIERLDPALITWATGQSIHALLTGGLVFGVELRRVTSSLVVTRAYALCESNTDQAEVADLYTAAVAFSGVSFASSLKSVSHGQPYAAP